MQTKKKTNMAAGEEMSAAEKLMDGLKDRVIDAGTYDHVACSLVQRGVMDVFSEILVEIPEKDHITLDVNFWKLLTSCYWWSSAEQRDSIVVLMFRCMHDIVFHHTTNDDLDYSQDAIDEFVVFLNDGYAIWPGGEGPFKEECFEAFATTGKVRDYFPLYPSVDVDQRFVDTLKKTPVKRGSMTKAARAHT